MTADTQTQSVPEQASGGMGRVARVIGAIVDVEFPQDAIPEINNALQVEVSLPAVDSDSEDGAGAATVVSTGGTGGSSDCR